jgi:hypothetical protein
MGRHDDCARPRRSWARSVFAPLAVSRQTFSAPAARKCFTCASPRMATARPLFQLSLSCRIMGAILPLYCAPETPFSIKGLSDVHNSWIPVKKSAFVVAPAPV